MNNGETSITASRSPRTRNIAWLGSWIAFSFVYAALMSEQSNGAMPLGLSARIALITTAVPALMATLIWRQAGRQRWSAQVRWSWFAGHAIRCLLFAAGWVGWVLVVAAFGSRSGMAGAPTHVALPWQVLTGALVYVAIAASAHAAQAGSLVARLEMKAERAERLRAQSQLASLRAHIDPHFFFNTLHSVAELANSDPAAAREAIERVSDLFRYTLQLDRRRVDLVSVEEEWTVIQSYLWLESLRLGARLRLVSSVDDDALLCAIPPFTLQPIVENAIRHGIAPKVDGGTVSISAREAGGHLEIIVSDDGIGVVASELESATGLGIRSVRERLAAAFGGGASLNVAVNGVGGTAAHIRLPAVLAPPRVYGAHVVTRDLI